MSEVPLYAYVHDPCSDEGSRVIARGGWGNTQKESERDLTITLSKPTRPPCMHDYTHVEAEYDQEND